MQFELLDRLSLPGDPKKPNDDALAFSDMGAVVMDGATGLGESLLDGTSDAAWVAGYAARQILAHLGAGNAPKDAVRAALEDTEEAFLRGRRRAPEETYEIPFASMMLLALADGDFDALWFGDCAALVQRPGSAVEVIGEAIEKRALERGYAERLAARLSANSAGEGVRDVFLPALRRARNTVNTPEGSWLFGPDARAADHLGTLHGAAIAGTLVLLVTDGLLALVTEYGRYTTESLVRAAQDHGLAALGRELREIEDGDPEGVRFPRFKKSDDATGLLLRLK